MWFYLTIEGFPALSLFEANFLAIVLDNLLAISASLTSVSFDLFSDMAAACSAIMDLISLFIPLNASLLNLRFSMFTFDLSSDMAS